MLRDAGLLAPQALWFLAGVVALAVFLRRAAKIRAERAACIGARIAGSRMRTLLPVLVALLLCLGMTRPYWGYSELEVRSVGRDIMVVLDVSLSMRAKDLSPSRLEFAKRKVLDIADWTRKHAPGDRIGIILFAGASYVYCPLTNDYSVIRLFTQSISTELITTGGSALKSALDRAATSFTETRSVNPLVILLSDGEDDHFSLNEARESIARANLKVLVLGVGTTQGSPIEQSDGRYVKDKKGDIVLSKLNEDSLRLIGEAGNGAYRQASLTDQDFSSFLEPRQGDDAAGAAGRSRTVRIYNEFGVFFVWGAIVLIALCSVFSRGLLTILFLCLVSGTPVHAESPEPMTEKPSAWAASQAYQRGDFEAAYNQFSLLLKEDPESLALRQSLASAAFKLKRYDEAVKQFARLETEAEKTRDGRALYAARYNLGNSLFARGELDKAIRAYDRALDVKTGDEQATFNRELAKKILLEKPTPTPTPTPTQSQEPESSPQNQEDSETTPASPSPRTTPGESESSNDSRGSESTPSPESPPTPASDAEKTPADDEGRQEQEHATPEPEEKAEGAPTPVENAPESEDEGAEGKETETTPESSATIDAEEAKAWLDSLPEAPLLLQRHNPPAKRDQEQLW